MGTFFYNIFLFLFTAVTRLAAPFNNKIKKWVAGRKDIYTQLSAAFANEEKVIWMHCASLGEFEQGRPLLEKFRAQGTRHKILLTFFSPSGYEIRKNYEGADRVFYLPMDGPRNARRFIETVKPSLVIFVKYEFWYYYLREIKKQDIPLLLVSGIFRPTMHFFKWYGGMSRKMLSCFTHFFVQNEESKKLLESISFSNVSITGDTRFDRVIEIAENARPVEIIEQFAGDSKTIIAGSTWPEDEMVLQKTMTALNDPSLKLIIAPHEIDEKHISDIEKLFPTATRYSQLPIPHSPLATCLIIDNIGLLSRIYKYAYIAYIGGGFNKSGIHNVLEAAVYGKPVLFGPVYEKFREAVDLVQNGGGFSMDKADEAIKLFKKLLENKEDYLRSCASSLDYVYANKGATDKIVSYIYKNRLLTN